MTNPIEAIKEWVAGLFSDLRNEIDSKMDRLRLRVKAEVAEEMAAMLDAYSKKLHADLEKK